LDGSPIKVLILPFVIEGDVAIEQATCRGEPCSTEKTKLSKHLDGTVIVIEESTNSFVIVVHFDGLNNIGRKSGCVITPAFFDLLLEGILSVGSRRAGTTIGHIICELIGSNQILVLLFILL
jgi:hypothetical protein